MKRKHDKNTANNVPNSTSSVASFYNSHSVNLQQYTTTENIRNRQKSDSFPVKALNNWIKSVLISRYIPENAYILDLCAGKGGDMGKYRHRAAKYVVFSDFSQESVQSAASRYEEMNNPPFQARFITADCMNSDISSSYDKISFDSSVCQFALHYAFDSEARLRNLLQNVSINLKPGGHFFGTLPCSEVIIKQLQRNKGSFGNSIFKISCDKTKDGGIVCPTLEQFKFDHPITSPFNHRYKFFLEDAVNNLDEYLVHFPTLVRIAHDFSLRLVLKRKFLDFYNDHRKEYSDLLVRMNVLDKFKLTLLQQQVAGIYLVFVFQKE